MFRLPQHCSANHTNTYLCRHNLIQDSSECSDSTLHAVATPQTKMGSLSDSKFVETSSRSLTVAIHHIALTAHHCAGPLLFLLNWMCSRSQDNANGSASQFLHKQSEHRTLSKYTLLLFSMSYYTSTTVSYLQHQSVSLPILVL